MIGWMPGGDSGNLVKGYDEDTGGGDTTTSIWSFSPCEPVGEEFGTLMCVRGELHFSL